MRIGFDDENNEPIIKEKADVLPRSIIVMEAGSVNSLDFHFEGMAHSPVYKDEDLRSTSAPVDNSRSVAPTEFVSRNTCINR